MGFLAAAAGLVGSLFSHSSGSVIPGAGYNPQLQALAAENVALTNQGYAQTYQENIAMSQTNSQMIAMSGESDRAQIRASALATITSRHEGLMQSIQQAESAHIKSSFDLVKNA